MPSPPRLIIRRSVINHETSASRTLQPRLSEPLALSALSGRLDLVVFFSRVLFPVMGALSRRLRLIYSFLHPPSSPPAPPPPSFIWALYWTPQNGVSPGPCLVVCGSHCGEESEMGEEEVVEGWRGRGVGIYYQIVFTDLYICIYTYMEGKGRRNILSDSFHRPIYMYIYVHGGEGA